MALLCADRDRHRPHRLQRRRAGAGRHDRARRPVQAGPAPGRRSGRHHRRRTRPRRAGHRPACARSGIVAQAQASSPLLNDSIGRQAESSGSRSTILSETEQLYFTGDTPFGIGPGGTKTAFQAHQYRYVKMAHDDYTAALLERGVLGGAGPDLPARHHRRPVPPDCLPAPAAGLRRDLPAPGTARRRRDRHVHLRDALPGPALPAPVGPARSRRRGGPVGPAGP